MQATANRADGQIEDVGDVVVVATFHFSQNQDRAVFVGKFGECPLHLHRPFLTQEVFIHPLTVILRLLACQFASLFDLAFVFFSPSPTDRGVKGDAIQPGVKRTAAGKRGKLEVGLNKRVLQGIFGFMPRRTNMHQGREQPILVFLYQFAIGLRVTPQRCLNQWCIVVRHVVETLDARPEGKVPQMSGFGEYKRLLKNTLPITKHECDTACATTFG